MVTDKSGDGSGARGSVHLDLPLSKPPDRPSLGMGDLVEGGIICFPVGLRMPPVPVGLDDQPSRLEHKVRLEASEHRLVHLKVETPLLELVTQKALNRGHLCGTPLMQSGLPALLSRLIRPDSFAVALCNLASLSQGRLTHLLSRFQRIFTSECDLAYLFARLRRGFGPKTDLAHVLAGFRRPYVNSSGHFMFNYST